MSPSGPFPLSKGNGRGLPELSAKSRATARYPALRTSGGRTQNLSAAILKRARGPGSWFLKSGVAAISGLRQAPLAV